jgi:hypothetical protein
VFFLTVLETISSKDKYLWDSIQYTMSLNAFVKEKLFFVLFFGLSTLLTWWFVVFSPLYISQKQMLLSTAVAGGKWGIQVLLAILFLKKSKWPFLENIAFVCFVGSCILMPYVGFRCLGLWEASYYFTGSLVVSVLVMIAMYYRAVMKSGIDLKWWLFWLLCLAIAISLQLTVVFHVIKF